jgi:hypothetical protein
MLNNPRFLLLAFVATLAIAIGAYWMGPVAGGRARLELLALDKNSRFAVDAELAAVRDSGGLPFARFPLIFAVRNIGVRTTSPHAITLSVPGWIRLYTADGTPLSFLDEGEALVHYPIALQGEPIDPGTLPLVPAGLERLWITAELAGITCNSRWDGVPEFAPAPEYDRSLLATIEAFYSLEAREDRYTGRLVIRLDPDRLHYRLSSADFQAGPLSLANGGVSLPRFSKIALEGTREVSCGAPEQRVFLQAVTWRTGEAGTGRWIVVSTRGTPRRMLYDTTGDGLVDFEAWDGEADGVFEASRSVSYRIPGFLLPLKPVKPAEDSTLAGARDTMPPGKADTPKARAADTANAMRPDTPKASPPDTTRKARPDTLPPPGSIVADALRRDSLRRDSLLRRARRDTIRQF